jgi:hypothetical protein
MRGPRTWALVLTMTVAGTAGVVGCGGGDGATSGVDVAVWRSSAELVCTDTRAALEASRPVTGVGNPAVPVRARAEAVKTQADDIRDLGQPTVQRDDAEAFVKALDDQAGALGRLADALLTDPTASAGTLGNLVTASNDRAVAAAERLELPSCASFASGTLDSDREGTNGTLDGSSPVDESDEPG